MLYRGRGQKSVEKARGRFWRISLKKSLCCRGAGGLGPTGLGTVVEVVASCRRWRGHRDQFGELAEVLGCGCEVELVAGPVRSS